MGAQAQKPAGVPPNGPPVRSMRGWCSFC